MPIEVICTGCQKRLRVGDQFAGRQAKCPQCQTLFLVPAGTTAPQINIVQAPAKFPSPLGSQTGGVERWYLQTEQGQQYGPISKAELDGWVMEGRVAANSQVLREGDASWQMAGDVYPVLRGSAPAAPQFATSAPGQNPFTSGSANPFAENSANPFAAPQTTTSNYSSRRHTKPHRGAMILTFAILGWAMSCVIFGIVAWVMGNADLEEMRRDRMDRAGEGLTRAGMIIGMVQSILVGVIVVIFMLLALVGGAR